MRRTSGIVAISATLVVIALSVLINFPYPRRFFIESDSAFTVGFIVGTFIIVLAIVWVIGQIDTTEGNQTRLYRGTTDMAHTM